MQSLEWKEVAVQWDSRSRRGSGWEEGDTGRGSRWEEGGTGRDSQSKGRVRTEGVAAGQRGAEDLGREGLLYA